MISSGSDLDLVLIGNDGPNRHEVEAIIDSRKLGARVQLLHDRPNQEVWWWMRHAECFVLPSREEPFGIVLLEAAKSRIPVVATRVGGIPEFLTDREDGLLCDPDNADQLFDALMLTLADREASSRRVESFYAKAAELSWEGAFDAYRRSAQLP